MRLDMLLVRRSIPVCFPAVLKRAGVPACKYKTSAPALSKVHKQTKNKRKLTHSVSCVFVCGLSGCLHEGRLRRMLRRGTLSTFWTLGLSWICFYPNLQRNHYPSAQVAEHMHLAGRMKAFRRLGAGLRRKTESQKQCYCPTRKTVPCRHSGTEAESHTESAGSSLLQTDRQTRHTRNKKTRGRGGGGGKNQEEHRKGTRGHWRSHERAPRTLLCAEESVKAHGGGRAGGRAGGRLPSEGSSLSHGLGSIGN